MRVRQAPPAGSGVWMKVLGNGSPIVKARKAAGLSQFDLAKLVDRTHTTIWKVETGKLPSVSPQLAYSIARYLHVDVEDLFEPRSTRTASVASVSADGGRAA